MKPDTNSRCQWWRPWSCVGTSFHRVGYLCGGAEADGKVLQFWTQTTSCVCVSVCAYVRQHTYRHMDHIHMRPPPLSKMTSTLCILWSRGLIKEVRRTHYLTCNQNFKAAGSYASHRHGSDWGRKLACCVWLQKQQGLAWLYRHLYCCQWSESKQGFLIPAWDLHVFAFIIWDANMKFQPTGCTSPADSGEQVSERCEPDGCWVIRLSYWYSTHPVSLAFMLNVDSFWV